MARAAEITADILGLADYLKSITIEAILAKGDAEFGLELLSGTLAASATGARCAVGKAERFSALPRK